MNVTMLFELCIACCSLFDHYLNHSTSSRRQCCILIFKIYSGVAGIVLIAEKRESHLLPILASVAHRCPRRVS